MFNKIKRYRRIRKTEKALNDLSDYELKDIGMSRRDIYFIARAR